MKSNHDGSVTMMIDMASDELVAYIMSKVKLSSHLFIGHNRFKVIDRILMNEMGRNVHDYWVNQSIVYKSMLRRRIWEQAILKIKAKEMGGTLKLGHPATAPLISVESLIESANAQRY